MINPTLGVLTFSKAWVLYQSESVAFDIIVDETHSGQTEQSAMKLKVALAGVFDALEEYAELEQKATDEVESKDTLVQGTLSQGKHIWRIPRLTSSCSLKRRNTVLLAGTCGTVVSRIARCREIENKNN